MRKKAQQEDSTEIKIREALLEDGFEQESSDRLARLLVMKPTPEERKRWEECKIIEGDQILLGEDEELGDGIVLALFDLVYTGMVKRV